VSAIRSESVLPADPPFEAVDTITLDETARHRRRVAMQSDHGIAFLLDLPEARLLGHGEGLVLSDGRIIQVRATPEDLMEVRATSPEHLVRTAWHVGNRHLPCEVHGDRLVLRYDHVIEHMLIDQGCTVTRISAPFQPESGAYGHGHDHDHGRDHDHG